MNKRAEGKQVKEGLSYSKGQNKKTGCHGIHSVMGGFASWCHP